MRHALSWRGMSALYGKATQRTPRATATVCEVCGQTLAARAVDHRRDGATLARRVDHAANRRRVDAYFAERAGVPEYAGLKACSACYGAICDATGFNGDTATAVNGRAYLAALARQKGETK